MHLLVYALPKKKFGRNRFYHQDGVKLFRAFFCVALTSDLYIDKHLPSILLFVSIIIYICIMYSIIIILSVSYFYHLKFRLSTPPRSVFIIIDVFIVVYKK